MKRSRLLAGLALGAAAMLTLTACADRGGAAGGEGGESFGKPTLVDSLPAGSQPVDEVNWAVVEGDEPLDPITTSSVIRPNLCESLLLLGADYSISPNLATSAEWVNPVTFVIDLRDDVTFWDGSPMTPEDVIYSMSRNWNPMSLYYGAYAAVAPGVPQPFDPATSIVKTGEHQVTVNFARPDSAFRDVLAGGAGVIVKQAFAEQAGQGFGTAEGGLMCTGPFKLAQGDWVPDQRLTVTANESYWGGEPLVKKINFTFAKDTASLTQALTSGEIDGAYTVSPSVRGTLEGEGSGTLYVGNSGSSYSFGPVSATSAAADPKVRQALSMAFDREQYIDVVLNGLGDTQKTFVAPFIFQTSPGGEVLQAGYDALDEPVYDIERAKALLEESGADTSVPLVLAIPAGSKELSDTAKLIQAAGKSIGLTIEINEMPPAAFGELFVPEATSAREGIDFLSTQARLDTPGFIGYPSTFLLPFELGGVYNWSGYENPQVIEHIMASQTATDPIVAAEQYVAAQALFAPDLLQVTLASAYNLSYLNDDLTGIVTSSAVYSTPWALHLGGK